MGQTRTGKNRGFTLLEMMIALAVGMIVLAAAVQLYSQGVDATWVESQKAEMQQDLRAASNLVVKDISLAGEGLPTETGVALPNGAGAVRSVYGCNQSGTCLPNGAVDFPYAPGGSVPTLYPIIPGYQAGITPPGSTTPSDLITVVYADPVLALDCYTVTFPGGGSASPLKFTAPAANPAGCTMPAGFTFPQSLTDPVYGLKAGDVLLFTSSAHQAIAEVTGVSGPSIPPWPVTGAQFQISFANGDPLKLNQSGAASGDLVAMANDAGVQAMRLEMITYYLLNEPDPTGLGTGTPTLMRQVNGQTAVPVAENVVNMQFTYDTYNADGSLLSGVGDGGYSSGVSYNLIRKINVAHLSIRSTMQGTRSALMATKGYQSFDFQTSVSARDLSYQQRY